MKALFKFTSYALLIFATGPLSAQNPRPTPPAPSVQEILDRMIARNAVQDRTLLAFSASRKFYAANFRFKTDSTMYVQTVFRRPDQLQPVNEVAGWQLDAAAKTEIDRILRETITDPVGPEFMVPPAGSIAA